MATKQKFKTQYWTAYQRRVVDFAIHYDEHSDILGQMSYVPDLVGEVRKLRRDLTRSWLLSFLGVVAILSGGLPTNAAIKLAGVDVPASLLTNQVLAVLVGVAWSYCIVLFVSMLLASAALKIALTKVYPESNEYFVAHKDARQLYAVMLTPVRIGFRSPLRERMVIWLNVFVAFTQIGLQWLVVIVAIGSAFEAARATGAWIPAALSGMSLSVVVVTGLSVLAWLVVPIPYRLPVDDLKAPEGTKG